MNRRALAAFGCALVAAVVAVGAVTEGSPGPTSATPAVVEVGVDARRAWQGTGVEVAAGDPVTIEVVGGVWTHWVGEVPYNRGDGAQHYVCAEFLPADQCVEPLPEYQAGALVARIGGARFGVGEGTTVLAPEAGEIELRVNDGDVGLGDNDGRLRVRVAVGAAWPSPVAPASPPPGRT